MQQGSVGYHHSGEHLVAYPQWCKRQQATFSPWILMGSFVILWAKAACRVGRCDKVSKRVLLCTGGKPTQAAARYWPDVFATEQAAASKPSVLEGMRLVRPVVETGCVAC